MIRSAASSPWREPVPIFREGWEERPDSEEQMFSKKIKRRSFPFGEGEGG